MTQSPNPVAGPVVGWRQSVDDGQPRLGRAGWTVPVALLGASVGVSGAFSPWLKGEDLSALGVRLAFGVACLLLSVLAGGLVLPAARAIATVRARRVLALVACLSGVGVAVLSVIALLLRRSLAEKLLGASDVEVGYGLVMEIAAGAVMAVAGGLFALLLPSAPTAWDPVRDGDGPTAQPVAPTVPPTTSTAPSGWGPPRG